MWRLKEFDVTFLDLTYHQWQWEDYNLGFGISEVVFRWGLAIDGPLVDLIDWQSSSCFLHNLKQLFKCRILVPHPHHFFFQVGSEIAIKTALGHQVSASRKLGNKLRSYIVIIQQSYFKKKVEETNKWINMNRRNKHARASLRSIHPSTLC